MLQSSHIASSSVVMLPPNDIADIKLVKSLRATNRRLQASLSPPTWRCKQNWQLMLRNAISSLQCTCRALFSYEKSGIWAILNLQRDNRVPTGKGRPRDRPFPVGTLLSGEASEGPAGNTLTRPQQPGGTRRGGELRLMPPWGRGSRPSAVPPSAPRPPPPPACTKAALASRAKTNWPMRSFSSGCTNRAASSHSWRQGRQAAQGKAQRTLPMAPATTGGQRQSPPPQRLPDRPVGGRDPLSRHGGQSGTREPCEWQGNAPGTDLSGERRCLRLSYTRGVVSEPREESAREGWAGSPVDWRLGKPLRAQEAGEWHRKQPICWRCCCGGWARLVGELLVLAAGGCALLGGSAKGGIALRRLRRGGSAGDRHIRWPSPAVALRAEGKPFAPSRLSCRN